MKCCGCNPMVGCMLFALLYMIAGVTMATTGIITVIRMPIVFKTGSVIWTGIMITGMGLLTVLIVVCRKTPDVRKTVSLLVLSIVVLVVCSVNIILFEMMEWQQIFGPKMELVDPDIDDSTGVFYAHLVCLVSTVTGLVSSFVGSIYICCMVDPQRAPTKTMNNVAGDPEMYKHKYLTASPPDFGNPSPSGLTRTIQGIGRLNSWTFEKPSSPGAGPAVSADNSDFTDEEPETVVRIEPGWIPRDHQDDQQGEGESGERDSMLGGPVVVTVAQADHDPSQTQEGGDMEDKRKDNPEQEYISALEIISTRL